MIWQIKINYMNFHIISCQRKKLFFIEDQKNSQIFQNRTYVKRPKNTFKLNIINIVKA